MRGRGSPLGIDLMGKGKSAPGGGTITMKRGSGRKGGEGGVGRLTGAERGRRRALTLLVPAPPPWMARSHLTN